MAKVKKPKAGRPKKPEGDKARPLNTSLPPEVYHWLTTVGRDGSASNGLRMVAVAAYVARNKDGEHA